ncbi:hypothetical protein PM082_012160 [Marasmius tenuissimus]|nr:hypothetical protein PM082_012160 [Marasmius tenuissimus]
MASSSTTSRGIPNRVTLYLYSDSSETGTMHLSKPTSQRFVVDRNTPFAKVFRCGLQGQEEISGRTASIFADLNSFHVFVAPSPSKNTLIVDRLENQDMSSESLDEHLTWLLEGYEKGSPFLPFLHQRAPYLLSHPARNLPVAFRRKTDMKMPAIQHLFPIGCDAFQIDREKHTNFDKDDYRHNRLTIEMVGSKETVQLELFREVLFGSPRIRINKAHIRTATRGVRFHCRDPWYWRPLRKASDCFDIYDDSDERPEDGVSNQVLRTLTIDTTRMRLRGHEYTQVDQDTSTSIKGSMVQGILCEVYRRPQGYWVTEDNSIRLTYILRYTGTDRAAHFTPRPDTSILHSPRPINPGETFSMFMGLMVVFCEIISYKSEVDRIRLLLEAAAFLRYLRAKGLRCSKTGETLIVALYLDASMVTTVYFLTMRDEPLPPAPSAGPTTRSYTSNKKTDPQVYVKRRDYPLSKKTETVKDSNGNPTGQTRTIRESQLIQFIKLQWDLERFLRELYADQTELVEEAVREARSLSTLLKNLPKMASASKVATDGIEVAEQYTGLRIPDSEPSRTLGTLSGPRAKSKSNKVSKAPSFQGTTSSTIPEEAEGDDFESGGLEDEFEESGEWDSDPPSDEEGMQ